MKHAIKSWPQYFEPLESGIKTFELRKNDRDYQVGDTLEIHEWSPSGYTGRKVLRTVTYVLHGPFFNPDHSTQTAGLASGWVIMGLS